MTSTTTDEEQKKVSLSKSMIIIISLRHLCQRKIQMMHKQNDMARFDVSYKQMVSIEEENGCKDQ